MVAATHMLVGGAVAGKARSIPSAMAMGALTHLLLDALPHRDYRRQALGGLALPTDLAAGMIGVWSLSRGSRTVLAGAVGGALPDALRVAELTTGVPLTIWAHDMAHTDRRPRAWRSAIAQCAIAMAAAVVLAIRRG